MGKKRQKVRWLCIEDSGRSQGVVGEGEEEEVSSAARMSLSPEQTIPIPHPPHRIYHLDKSSNLNNGTNNPSSSTYARRPVAPRFERKAAAAEVLYDSRQFRGRELSGESGEELPLGFTKIRSKNLDVLFKRDYYSTKGMNSEANTHSETSSLTQKEDEKEEDVEEEEEEEEEEELEEEYEEEISSNNKKESTPKLTSKLNGSSSPFYPSSPGYVMSMHHPYMTGRPNLFLYSPSSNTMIPCEEVVVPGMFSGSPSSPQNVYLAAFPMEGSNPYMMHPSYAAPPPPYYPPQPVYSDAEPSSAESTVPHSPPDLSAYNPAYWGEVHSHRGYYPHPSYQYQADQVYSQTSLEASPQQTPEEVPEIEHSLPDKKEETDYNNDNRRVPGLPPQPKKSQKKKRKKKSKQPSELVHRNSTSSEDGQTIHHIKDEVPSNIEQTKSDEVSTEESMNEFKPSASSSPSVVIEEEEVAKSEEENQILEDVSKSAPQVVEPSPSSSSPDDNEDIIELVAKSQVIETPVPIIEESTTEPHCSPEPEVVPPPEEEEEEKISQVVLDEKVEEVKKLPMEDVEEKVDIVADKTPRMLYSSVVSQSMPQPPPKSPVHNKTPKKSLTEASPPLPKVELPISTSMENLRPTEKVEKEESEWLESSSRKKVKRHRQSKKSKSSKYSSSLSSSMIRSVSLDTSSKKEVSIVQHQKKETEIEDLPATTCSLDVLPSCFKSEESSDVATTTTTTPTPTPPQESETEKQLVDPSPQREEKSNELAEEKMPSNSLVSKKSVVKKKKKRGNNGGGGGIASDSSSKSLNSGESSAKKQVLICDGDIDVSSSFSSFKKVSDFGNLRIHSQPFSKVSLDTVFISDVGIGIRNGPIMSGRPLRVGKYSPPDRAKEILSMKASLSTEDSTTTTTTTTKENNAQYTVPLD